MSAIVTFFYRISFISLCFFHALLQSAPTQFVQLDRLPAIDPDYAGVTVPPNIAPMNFIIQESGSKFTVVIAAERGKAIHLNSRSPKIRIPNRAWKKLLANNAGSPLAVTIYAKENGRWLKYQPITNRIAREPINSHLVYRLIKPLYVYWNRIGIYQRDLTSFFEKPILLNKNTGDNCINCHAFSDRRPDRMLLHTRAGAAGTAMLLALDGEVRKIDTATEFNRAVAYRAWHPSGKAIAFSSNTVNQFFHAVGENRDVYDKASDLLIYTVSDHRISGAPQIAREDKMETYPEWSPDGKYLYFCRTDGLEKYDSSEHPFRKIKYDLMRIACDPENGTWGEVEPVLIASAFGKSVTHPKVSPDGRYILLCLSEYGNFSIYRPDADLCLYDLQTGELRAADALNSDRSESYHSWDSSGRWVVFSSKREDGLCARPFFSYFDESGQFAKPFILPQKDPAVYSRLLKTFNVPEFVNGRVKISGRTLLKAAWGKPQKAKLDPALGEKTHETADEMWKPVPR